MPFFKNLKKILSMFSPLCGEKRGYCSRFHVRVDLSRRDLAKVAWHEVPGKPKEGNPVPEGRLIRPVFARLSSSTQRKLLMQDIFGTSRAINRPACAWD